MVTRTTVADIRRENLRKLIRERFNNHPTELAAELGYTNGSFIVQMAGPAPSRPVSERTARRIEAALGLPDGWMDVPQAAPAGQAPYPVHAATSGNAPIPMVGADTPLVADVVRMVGQVMEDEHVHLPPAKLADIVALAWTDTLEHQGKPRESYVRGLVKLVKS